MSPRLLALLVLAGLCNLLAVHAWDAIPPSDAIRQLDTGFVVPSPVGASSDPALTSQQRDAVRGTQFQLYNYITAGYDPFKVRRAVITLHGLARDAWSYFDQTNEALTNATSRRDTGTRRARLTREEVVIMAPFFMNEEEAGAFPVDEYGQPTSNALVWRGSSWAEGADTVFPATLSDRDGTPFPSPGVSSFEAMDEVVRFFANRTQFPALNTIIVAGHSLGAQMVQRYALIGSVPSGSVPVHFVVANPGSFAYLTDWRPESVDGCPERYNNWKYGLMAYGYRYLSDFISESLDSTNDIQSIVDRYRERIVSYLFGLEDHGPGDTRCEALTQGDSHLTRGRNYMQHLADMDGGFPATHTVNYVPNVSHDGLGMFTSRPGLERLFFINLNGTETPTAVGDNDTAVRSWTASHEHSAGAVALPCYLAATAAAALALLAAITC